VLAKQKTAFQAFERDLSQLRISREQQLGYFKSLVSKEQWPWAKKHAALFVQHTADLWPISVLGNQADYHRFARDIFAKDPKINPCYFAPFPR